MRFARLELGLVWPTIVSRADFELASDLALDFQLGVTIQPDVDIKRCVQKR